MYNMLSEEYHSIAEQRRRPKIVNNDRASNTRKKRTVDITGTTKRYLPFPQQDKLCDKGPYFLINWTCNDIEPNYRIGKRFKS